MGPRQTCGTSSPTRVPVSQSTSALELSAKSTRRCRKPRGPRVTPLYPHLALQRDSGGAAEKRARGRQGWGAPTPQAAPPRPVCLPWQTSVRTSDLHGDSTI